MDRADGKAPLRSEHARRLGKGMRPVDEVHHEPHQRAFEPSVLEGQLLGRRDLDRAYASARQLRHLGLGLDAPDARAALRERLRSAAGAATDVEDAPPREVALANEQLEDLPPVRVGRTELVVAPRNRTEIRLRRRSPPAR